MKSSIIALVTFGLLLTFVQCKHTKGVEAEYTIQQGSILNRGGSYDIKSKTNAASSFKIDNQLLHVGKKLTLLENGKPRFIVRHELLNLWSTWKVTDATDKHELSVIKHKFEVIGSEIDANGELGHYKIEGQFLNRNFTIKKNGHKLAKIEKKSWHLRDTYGLTVYGDADQALMVLFTVVMDEILKH